MGNLIDTEALNVWFAAREIEMSPVQQSIINAINFSADTVRPYGWHPFLAYFGRMQGHTTLWRAMSDVAKAKGNEPTIIVVKDSRLLEPRHKDTDFHIQTYENKWHSFGNHTVIFDFNGAFELYRYSGWGVSKSWCKLVRDGSIKVIIS